MSNLFLTLMIAFVVIVFAIACLAVGWLITGKTKLEKGCGNNLSKEPTSTSKNQSSCEHCSNPEQEEKLKNEKKEVGAQEEKEEGDKRYS